MDSKYSIHVENVALQVPKLQPSIIFVSTELHSPQHARLGLLPNKALRRFSWAILPLQKNARWDHENIRTLENLQNDASGFFKRKKKRKKKQWIAKTACLLQWVVSWSKARCRHGAGVFEDFATEAAELG